MNELFEFQLLRPYWLLACLPVVWLLWRFWQSKTKQGAWHQVIAPQFRHLLLGADQTGQVSLVSKLSIVGLGLIWLLAIIALTGPSLKSVEVPAEKNQQGSVIVLDLSLSMLADDLAPNRLSRVRYKITDLLKQHPELSIGLVGYAGTAHSISPISEDNQTLLGMLPALNPVIMPSYGSNPLLGFEKAKTLFEGAHINHGHIIWITDDLEIEQKSALENWIKQHDYSLSILTVGTATGGAVHIPNYGLLKDEAGKIILPTLPMERFNSLGQLDKVTLSHLTTSDQSLKALLPPILAVKNETDSEGTNDTRVIHPLDGGIFLLLLLVPLVALLYRRGWILSLSFVSLPLVGVLSAGLLSVGLFTPNTSYAEDKMPALSDFFQSPDQQGYKAWQENNVEAAESLFEDDQWRASSLYRLEKYQEAAELFAKDSSATGLYNHGNALAKSGQLEEAKQAYENALDKQADFSAAQQNLEIINQLLTEQKQQQEQQKQTQDNEQNKPLEDQKQQDGQENNDPSNQNQQNSDSQENSSNPTSQDSKSEEGQSSENQDSKDEASTQQSNASNAQSNSENTSQNKNDDLNNEAVPEADHSQSAEQNDQEDQTPPHSENSLQDSTQNSGNEEQADLNQSKLADEKLTAKQNPQNQIPLSAEEQEQQQATQNWLKQIPDEPGLFLKRKFEYQYQQQSNQAEQSNSGNKQW